MYATGSCSSPQDLLNSLKTFALGAGWTVDNAGPWIGGDYWLAVHKGACFLHYYATADNVAIQLWGATGFNGAGLGATGGFTGFNNSGNADAHLQPGVSPGFACFNPGVGPFVAYHFFGSTADTYLHFVCEVTAGIFGHMNGGVLLAAGGAAPAIYITATHWTSFTTPVYWAGEPENASAGNTMAFAAGEYNPLFILCNVDGALNWFTAGNASPTRLVAALSAPSKTVNTFGRSPNTFNQLSVLIPLSFYLERTSGNVFSYAGDAIDARLITMQNYAPKDEIPIGGDTWKVFPMIAKAPIAYATSPPGSGNYGLAYRKNAA